MKKWTIKKIMNDDTLRPMVGGILYFLLIVILRLNGINLSLYLSGIILFILIIVPSIIKAKGFKNYFKELKKELKEILSD